jgi:hypothetical protein
MLNLHDQHSTFFFCILVSSVTLFAVQLKRATIDANVAEKAAVNGGG